MTKEADIALPNLSIIGSAYEHTMQSKVSSVFMTLGEYEHIAREAGYDGTAITPTRKTSYEAHYGVDTGSVLALHESFRSERTLWGILRHPNKLFAAQAFLTFPHCSDSLVPIHQLQELHFDSTGETIPVIFQTPEDIRLPRAKTLKYRVLIASPESYVYLEAHSPSDYVQKVKSLGFDGGLSLEPYQLQRRHMNGRKSPFQNLEHSLTSLWESAAIAIISFRDDLVTPATRPEHELQHFLQGQESTTSYQLNLMRQSMNKTGHIPLFQIQVPHTIVAAYYQTSIATHEMVIDVHEKLQRKVRKELGS